MRKTLLFLAIVSLIVLSGCAQPERQVLQNNSPIGSSQTNNQSLNSKQTLQTIPETEQQKTECPDCNNKSTTEQGKYICSRNAYNCSDFNTHAQAQAVYEACGGKNNDIHKLDADLDGKACESLH